MLYLLAQCPSQNYPCMCLYQVTMTLHFLNGIFNDVVSTRKTNITSYYRYSLKSEPTCKLINRIPGLSLLISSLPGSASRMHVESLGKPHYSTKCCLVNLISKDILLEFSIFQFIQVLMKIIFIGHNATGNNEVLIIGRCLVDTDQRKSLLCTQVHVIIMCVLGVVFIG